MLRGADRHSQGCDLYLGVVDELWRKDAVSEPCNKTSSIAVCHPEITSYSQVQRCLKHRFELQQTEKAEM